MTTPWTGEGWAMAAAGVGPGEGIAGASRLPKVLAVPRNGVALFFGSCVKEEELYLERDGNTMYWVVTKFEI